MWRFKILTHITVYAFFQSNKCGNPTQLGRCYQCKAEIGGESSKLRADNAKDIGYELNRKDVFFFVLDPLYLTCLEIMM